MDAFREYLSATNPANSAPRKAPISSIPVIRLLHRRDKLQVRTVSSGYMAHSPLVKARGCRDRIIYFWELVQETGHDVDDGEDTLVEAWTISDNG
jgi:hypothetical protein